MSNLEISKMLTISTAHLTYTTAHRILAVKSIVAYKKDIYGYFIHIDVDNGVEEIDDAADIPDDLKAAMKYALKNGCEWLCVDRDGPAVDELPTYDW